MSQSKYIAAFILYFMFYGVAQTATPLFTSSHTVLPRPERISDYSPENSSISDLHFANKSLDSHTESRDYWSEVPLIVEPAHGQGKVDMVTGPNGNLWAVFFDDQDVPAGNGRYFIMVSTDGGHSWSYPWASANGFILTNDYGDYPSLAVKDIGSGVIRVLVAVTGAYSSHYNTYCCYKNAGTGSWSMQVVQGVSETYLMPRMIYAGTRLIVATVRYADGNFFTDYSDSNGASWGSYSQISQASPGFYQVCRPDLAYDSASGYLFCTMNGSLSSDQNKLYCLLSLSTNRAGSWKTATSGGTDIGPWSVGSTANYSHENGVVEVPLGASAGQRHWIILVSNRAASASDDLDMGFVYGDYSQIVDHGTWWEVGITTPKIFPRDPDGDESIASITVEPGTAGGFHAAWIDENTLSTSEVLYSSCSFSDMDTWLTPDIVTTSGQASPSTQSPGCAIALADISGSPYPVVDWVDNRASVDVYSAYRSAGPSPTPTLSPSPTAIPSPVPATGHSGLLLLSIIMGILVLTSTGASRRYN